MALFGDGIFFDIFVIVTIFYAVAYVYVVRKRNKWSKKGIPVRGALPFFGNMKDVILRRKHMHENIRDFYLKNKNKPFVTFFALTQPMVVINDMELIRSILIKDFQVFSDRHMGGSKNEPLFFWNMFTSKGEFWRNLRQKLSPTFTSGKMKKMFELIDSCGKEFVSHLEREMEKNGDIDIKEAAARFTSDIITSAAFGVDGDAMKNKDSAFRRFMRMSSEPTPIEGIKFLLAFLYPSLIKKFDLRLIRAQLAEFVRKTVWSTVEYREKNKVKRNDFLDIMMQLRSKGYIEDDDTDSSKKGVQFVNGLEEKVKVVFDGDVFVAQCFLFMSAGFDTSATTITWALYELSLHPDIQERAHEEIEQVLDKHGGKVTYEAMQEMEYLQRVVQETLRKYPVVSFLDRETTRPYKIPGTKITLQQGQGVMIPVSGVHFDPDIYPEPETFDPERFTPENTARRPPCSFLGFGDGPRICLGMRMGLLQTKVGLVYFLKNFVVKICERTPTSPVYDKSAIIASSENGMMLRLTSRTANRKT